MASIEGLPIGFDLNLLRALERLLTMKSVGRAARGLAVGQPAMSKTLARLRDELGDPLLVRVGHAMVPTARGVSLLEPVRAALAAASKVLVRPEAFDPKTAQGRVAVALPEYAQMTVAVPFALRLQAAAPGVDLRFRPLGVATLGDIARGDVDLAVVPDLSNLPGLPRHDASAFVIKPLYRERYAVASRPARRRKKWTLDAYVAARHLLVTALGESDIGVVDAILRQRGLTRRVAVTVPNFLQAARMIATTDLVATLPERMLHTIGYPLDIQPCPIPIPDVPLHVMWHPRDTHDARHRWLRDEVFACVGGPASSARQRTASARGRSGDETRSSHKRPASPD